MKTWPYPSSSGPDPHTTTLHDSGQLTCSCLGYKIKKQNKPRECSHIKDVIKKHALEIERRGDDLFALNGTASEVPAQAIDHADNYHKAYAAGYVEPMLAVPMADNAKFENYSSGWIMEEKFDGQRVILAVGSDVLAWSRPRSGKGKIGLPRRLPSHIVQFAKKYIPQGTYDCEEIVPGDGLRSWDVSKLETSAQRCLMVFDVMHAVGSNCMSFPIQDRRRLLEQCIPRGSEPIRLSAWMPPDRTLVEAIWERGGEGAIIKRLGSIYAPGRRSPEWLKVKLKMNATLVITGYKKGENGPYSSVELIGDDGIGTKVKTKNNDWLRLLETDPQKYIGKRLRIEYQGRTPDKKYRHPMWDHFEDEL